MSASRQPSGSACSRRTELLRCAGLDEPDLAHLSTWAEHGPNDIDPLLEVAGLALGLVGLSAARHHELRTGVSQRISVSPEAVSAALRSHELARLDGKPLPQDHLSNPTIGLYRTGDGWFFVHGGVPSLKDGLLRVLGCAPTKVSVERAMLRWTSADLEDALAAAGFCGAAVRTRREWLNHPQGVAMSGAPAVEILRSGYSPVRRPAPGSRPLEGVRVLDLTRILAGPTCGRLLAEQGADVLRISSPVHPDLFNCLIDTGHGKRHSYCDLTTSAGAARLRSLLLGADVVIDGYRSGALERLGFGVRALQKLRPGLVVVSINCYGHLGPWKPRRGFEQLAQVATGMAVANRTPDGRPQLLPVSFHDYTTGYLAAHGAIKALTRRATEGGDYWVRASLVQTANWLLATGPRAPHTDVRRGDVVLMRRDSAFGIVDYLPSPITMEVTPAFADRPPSPAGADRLEWCSV
jgi:crotonobetainyl-CoA:carnitine CoA-transferase CaiB-like acyl-CoA transferase